MRYVTAVAMFAILLSQAVPVRAHRLDEYLQATTISVARDRVQVEVRLTPGVAVFREVLAAIDVDGDGAISEADRRAYAGRFLRDVSLKVDDRAVKLRLVSSDFPKLEEMWEGTGEIVLHLQAEVPGGGVDRALVFENHHMGATSAYLVNCLVPADPRIRVTGQSRNEGQSLYRLNYSVGVAEAGRVSSPSK